GIMQRMAERQRRAQRIGIRVDVAEQSHLARRHLLRQHPRGRGNTPVVCGRFRLRRLPFTVAGVTEVHTSKLRGRPDDQRGHYHRTVPSGSPASSDHRWQPMSTDPSAESTVSEYLILQLPSANRVYADDAPRLMRAELAVFGEAVGGIADTDEVELAGLHYVRFTAPELTGDRLALLS